MTQVAPARAGYADAVDALAVHLREALDGVPGKGSLTRFVATAADRNAALAAIRILGADALAVHRFAGLPPTAAESDLIVEAIELFPRRAEPPYQIYLQWQDWAFAEAAGHTGGPPCPAEVPALVDWASWSRWLAPLSALALPGLRSPLHEAAAERVLAVAGGATKAVVRRDYATAGALGRWLAMLRADGAELPIDASMPAEHAGRYGGADARTALDSAIARRFLP
ncbi:hypothetical protein ACWKSP_18780 [Micromonosporaceae bacterium Da 78-11]